MPVINKDGGVSSAYPVVLLTCFLLIKWVDKKTNIKHHCYAKTKKHNKKTRNINNRKYDLSRLTFLFKERATH